MFSGSNIIDSQCLYPVPSILIVFSSLESSPSFLDFSLDCPLMATFQVFPWLDQGCQLQWPLTNRKGSWNPIEDV